MRSTFLTASLIAAGALAGCSSAPKVPQADESTRRPANDPAYIEMVQARAALDRARQELELQRRAAAAQRMIDASQQPTPALVRASLGLPATDVTAAVKGQNVVYTALFPVGGSRLELNAQATSVLASAVRQAPLVMVRGRTDAAQANLKDERIARQRAEAARSLLVSLGVPSKRIRVTWQSAGDAVAPLDTAAGRAANRRVEVEVYGAAPVHGTLDVPQVPAAVAQQ